MMQDKFGQKVKFNIYGQKKHLLSRFGVQFFGDLNHSIEERVAFSHFGL
jgi:serine protease SohB